MAKGAIAVTGTSRGIGATIAAELKRRGFTVGCLSRAGGLPAGEDDDPAYHCAQCDVTDEASIRDALQKCDGRGRPDRRRQQRRSAQGEQEQHPRHG